MGEAMDNLFDQGELFAVDDLLPQPPTVEELADNNVQFMVTSVVMEKTQRGELALISIKRMDTGEVVVIRTAKRSLLEQANAIVSKYPKLPKPMGPCQFRPKGRAYFIAAASKPS